MSAEVKKEIELEIAHVLFIDLVGYSKLLIDDQRELQQLNQIVRGTGSSARPKPWQTSATTHRRWHGTSSKDRSMSRP